MDTVNNLVQEAQAMQDCGSPEIAYYKYLEAYYQIFSLLTAPITTPSGEQTLRKSGRR